MNTLCNNCQRELCMSCAHERELTNPTDIALFQRNVFLDLSKSLWRRTDEYITIFHTLSHIEMTRVAMFLVSKCGSQEHELRMITTALENPKCDVMFRGVATREWLEFHHGWYANWFNRNLTQTCRFMTERISNMFNSVQHKSSNARRASLFVVHSFRLLYGRDIAKIIAKLVYETRGDSSWYHR